MVRGDGDDDSCTESAVCFRVSECRYDFLETLWQIAGRSIQVMCEWLMV